MGDITLANVETSARISVQNGYRILFPTCTLFKRFVFILRFKILTDFFFYMCNLQKIYERMCFP